MWFSPEFTKGVEAWREKHKDKFIIIVPLKGSTNQKFFHLYKEFTEAVLGKYDNALVYFAGDASCRQWMIDHERVKPMFGDHVSIKQAVLHTKHADMVVGPETSLLVAAGMFGTPKTIMATTSSVWQMAQYQKNDFSIQAPLACSPCHRAIYGKQDCEQPIDNGDDLMDRVDWVYKGVGK
jgi:ADP-heptose:LPS heptosyltransferase